MAFLYTQSQLQSAMNRGIQGKQGLLISPQDTMNEAVRETLSEIRIRSTRRKAALVPNLLNGIFEYVVASDLEAAAIIDIPAQATREDGEFTLVPTEQFARAPKVGDIAIDDYNGIRVLNIFSQATDSSLEIDRLSAVGTGEWLAFGTAEELDYTTDDFIKNGGSVEFDLSSTSGTTAGIYKNALDSDDLSEYISHVANVFVYARITSTTNLTNYKLRLGTSASAYFEATVTTRADGTAFTAGWNLLKFDLSSVTTTGTPDTSDITYAAIFMTKTTGKINEDGYMFNWLCAKKGRYADVRYYTKYGWQTSVGAYIENSTSSLDVLVADTDEFDIFAKKCIAKAARECDMPQQTIDAKDADYEKAKANYQILNPSEDKIIVSTYHTY